MATEQTTGHFLLENVITQLLETYAYPRKDPQELLAMIYDPNTRSKASTIRNELYLQLQRTRHLLQDDLPYKYYHDIFSIFTLLFIGEPYAAHRKLQDLQLALQTQESHV